MPASNLGVLLGERIRSQRELLGLSQAKFAEVAGVTPNYVGVVERGEKLPTLETLEAMARALGVEAGALLMRESPDTWADAVAALARAIPPHQRGIVLALLKAAAGEARHQRADRAAPPRDAPRRKKAGRPGRSTK